MKPRLPVTAVNLVDRSPEALRVGDRVVVSTEIYIGGEWVPNPKWDWLGRVVELPTVESHLPANGQVAINVMPDDPVGRGMPTGHAYLIMPGREHRIALDDPDTAFTARLVVLALGHALQQRPDAA